MARIHESSVKWLNEQLKKKHLKSNNVVVEEDLKQCIYCHKLFLNATFVVKHIFKRHAEQFLHLHKKFIETTKTGADLDPKSVLVYLKSEFSNLKTELELVKKAVTDHTHVNDQFKNQVTYPIGCQGSKDCGEGSNINALGDKLVSNNPEDTVESVKRENFMKLQARVEELFRMHKEVVSSSKDKAAMQEDRICKRLKNELLTDFENLLIRYQDQNLEWKVPFFQLKHDLQKIEQAVQLNAKKIESPEVLKEIENKIEQQIESFYASFEIFDGRDKTPSKTSRKVLSDNSLSAHRSNRRKKSIFTCSSQGLNLQTRQLDASIRANDPQIPGGLSKTYNAQTSSILKGDSKNIQKLGTEKAKLLLEDKLKDLSISSKVKQLSNEEYSRKIQLVNAQKELLCQKYDNFQQVYERLDLRANKLVKSQMERKLRKQLRFSDSMPSQVSESKDKTLGEQAIEKSSLSVGKTNSGFIQQSEFMHGFNAYGDFSNIKNDSSSEYVDNLSGGDCAVAASEGFKFQEHFVTFPHNLPPSDELAELTLVDNPDRSLPPNDSSKSVDEFSELSSLDSDSNLS